VTVARACVVTGPYAALTRSSVTWQYLPRGGVKHALPTGKHGGHARTARLPECRRCARLLAGEVAS
jgi:hypothetical protein